MQRLQRHGLTGQQETHETGVTMKYYVVLDTNVVVSALLGRASVPGAILEEALTGRIIPLLHEDILEEYNDVLHRPKFKFDGHDIEVALAGLIKRGIFIDAAPVEDYIPDPDDAVFYQVVMEARKAEDAYLVTGNLKHFPVKTFVVTPKEMLDIINENDR